MQIKAIKKYHLIPVRKYIIKKKDKIKHFGKDVEKREICMYWGECTITVEISMEVLHKLKIELLYD